MKSRMDQSGSFGDNSYTCAAYLFDVATSSLLQSFTNPTPTFFRLFRLLRSAQPQQRSIPGGKP